MSNMPPVLSMALGAGETSLIKLTSAYASLANGGKKVEASIIDRIQDRRGQNIFVLEQVICENCNQPYIEEDPKPKIRDKLVKEMTDNRCYVISCECAEHGANSAIYHNE